MANFCKNCGVALEPGSRFCKACGAQVETAQKSFCPACGRELEPGALFCPGCGARVGTAAVQAPAARPAPTPAAPRSSSASRGAAAQGRNTPKRSSARPPAPEKPKKSRKGLAVFLVLVVLAGLAFAAFKTPGFLVKDKRPDYTFYKWPTAQPSAAPTAAPTAVPRETESGDLSAQSPSITLCGVTVDVDPAMLSSGNQTVSVSVCEGGTENGAAYDHYELHMGSGEFERPVEVTFPCRIPADMDVSVVHYEDGEWKPLLSFVDESAGTVTAYFDSFSPARVVYRPVGVNPSLYYVETDEDDPWVQTLVVRDSSWAILRRTNPALYGPEVERYIDDPANYALAAPRLDPNMDTEQAFESYMKASQIWGFVDPLINIGIESLPPQSTSRVVSFMIDHSGKLSNAMNAIPFITMGVQLAYDMRNWDLDSIEPAGVNLYKNLIGSSGTIYSLVTGYSHLGFTLAFMGVAVFGMELDYFVDAAKEAQAENIRDVYKAYYEKVEPFDDEHWYLVFEDAYWHCGNDPDKAMKMVKDAVDAYCEKFWTEVYKDSNEDLIFAVGDANYKNVFMNATPAQKQALTEQQKREVWQLIETKSMKKIQRFLLARLQEETSEYLDQIVRPYNVSLCFTIQETIDQESSAKAQYTGCTLALGVGGKPLPGWSLTIPDDEIYEDGWRTEFRCTVYGYLRMGMPNQLLVYASEEDLANGAAPLRTVDFIPVMDGNRDTEIELSLGDVPGLGNNFELKEMIYRVDTLNDAALKTVVYLEEALKEEVLVVSADGTFSVECGRTYTYDEPRHDLYDPIFPEYEGLDDEDVFNPVWAESSLSDVLTGMLGGQIDMRNKTGSAFLTADFSGKSSGLEGDKDGNTKSWSNTSDGHLSGTTATVSVSDSQDEIMIRFTAGGSNELTLSYTRTSSEYPDESGEEKWDMTLIFQKTGRLP